MSFDIQRAKELLDYNPEDGLFRWKVKCQKREAGYIAGHYSKEGYVIIGLNKKVIKAHRLAWIFVND